MKKQKHQNKTSTTRHSLNSNQKQQLADHLSEIRLRLFVVVGVFILASALAYPFYHKIMTIIFAPLQGRELVYLTPIGGFSFIIKICTYIGIIFAVPFFVYHAYKFLQPVMSKKPIAAKRYFMASMLLACFGIAFAYFILLPAALRFLTNLDIQQVSAMLTVDSYMNFVIAYILGSALMFQLPLIVLVINNIKPVTPKRLMKYQKHIILGAFIFAAVLSPTPDIINQSLMAAPIVVMYQIAIILIIFVNRKKVEEFLHISPEYEKVESVVSSDMPISNIGYSESVVEISKKIISQPNPNPNLRPRVLNSDGYIRRKVTTPIISRKPIPKNPNTIFVDRRSQSMDGFFVPQRTT